MSRLVEGEWVDEENIETDDDGEFTRQESAFRDRIGPGEAFPVESGRYHLYISRACPWAHRVAMTRALKGLDAAISLSLVEPVRYDDGWEFSDTYPDPHHDVDFLRELYVRADPEFTGRPTVPLLWDLQTETAVNNESEEVMRMLDVAGHELATRDVDLYPEGYRDEVDERIDDIYDPINNGVYRAGFAKSQSAYDRAVDDLFDALDRYDDRLADQRYLVGDVLTEADLAMFATLVRFDHVYHTHFKCNRRAIHEYDNLWGYTKDIYTTPGIEGTVNVDHIVRHYYESHANLNPKRLVPTGPDIDFTEGHDRDQLPGGPPEALQDS